MEESGGTRKKTSSHHVHRVCKVQFQHGTHLCVARAKELELLECLYEHNLDVHDEEPAAYAVTQSSTEGQEGEGMRVRIFEPKRVIKYKSEC